MVGFFGLSCLGMAKSYSSVAKKHQLPAPGFLTAFQQCPTSTDAAAATRITFLVG